MVDIVETLSYETEDLEQFIDKLSYSYQDRMAMECPFIWNDEVILHFLCCFYIVKRDKVKAEELRSLGSPMEKICWHVQYIFPDKLCCFTNLNKVRIHGIVSTCHCKSWGQHLQ